MNYRREGSDCSFDEGQPVHESEFQRMRTMMSHAKQNGWKWTPTDAMWGEQGRELKT
jgi:hypothetical protein